MASASLLATGKANRGTDQMVGRQPTDRSSRPVGRVAHVLRAVRDAWPLKTAHVMAAHTGRSVRAAERWLAGTRDMSAEDFIALLTSDRGADILEALILSLPENERMFFWNRVKRAVRRAEIHEQRRLNDAEMEQLNLLDAEPRLRRRDR